MAETGTMGLTVTLSVVAFLTNTVFVLPIIAFSIIHHGAFRYNTVVSKKYRNGKKVFLVAPIHHHFEVNRLATITKSL